MRKLQAQYCHLQASHPGIKLLYEIRKLVVRVVTLWTAAAGPSTPPDYRIAYIPFPIRYTLTFMANHAPRRPHGTSLLER